MTKEYLKMADVFRNEIRVTGDSNNMISDDVGIIIGCYSGDKMAAHVLHAINSHDELVAEVERLRGMIDALEIEHENIIANILDKASALGVYI